MAYNVDRVSFAYGKEKAVDDFSMTLRQGVFYGLLGPNGCGKSTLVDLLMNYIRPDSGTITFMGKEIGTYKPQALSERIALVPQNTSLNFQYSVEQIVMMGRHPYIGRFQNPLEDDYAMVEKAMICADILKLREKPVTELSGGERQRTLFARAIAQDTPVILLDEATSSMDVNHAVSILDLIRDAVEKDGKTVVSVFQDINLAALYCDHFVFMNNGSLMAEGRVGDIFTEETIQTVFGIQSRIGFNTFANAKQVAFKRTSCA